MPASGCVLSVSAVVVPALIDSAPPLLLKKDKHNGESVEDLHIKQIKRVCTTEKGDVVV